MPEKAPILVLVDVGNTNTVFGVERAGGLLQSFRLSTETERTADEYASLILPLLAHTRLDPRTAEAVVVSSVVPPLNVVLDRLAREYFHCEPLFVGPDLTTDLELLYENPAEIGADRIVNAVAAKELYGAPVVVVDFGTATTFDVVNAEGQYAGGIIAPGIGISTEALFARASRLYKVDIRKPDGLVGRNTAGAMQSGIYYGYVGLVDGILDRLLKTLPGSTQVVATGGLADLMASGARHLCRVDSTLTLTGLKLIYERNRPGS